MREKSERERKRKNEREEKREGKREVRMKERKRELEREEREGSVSFGKTALHRSPGQLKFCRYFKAVIYFRSTVQVRVQGCPRPPILHRLLIDSNQNLAAITRETK